eukprot:gene7973-9507_t
MKLIENLDGYYLVGVGSVVLKVSTTNTAEVQTISTEKSGDSHVVTLTVSKETGHLFVGYSNKVVASFSLGTLELVGSIVLRKQPTAIQYSSFLASAVDRTAADPSKVHHVLLASDKAGEVFAINAPLLEKQVLLAGHTASVITDLAIHASAKAHYVATSDRDEKIRISHFPDMENIHTFLLGHTKVVASVNFVELNGKVLALTTGWDHKLNLWDAHSGNLLQPISFLTETDKAESSASVEQKEGETEEAEGDVVAEATEPVEGGDNDGEEDLEGKVYDEISAGNYPMKVVSNQTLHNGSEALVSVLFKGLATLKVFRVSAQANTVSMVEVATVTLRAVPVDVSFVAQDQLAVLLPKPYGLQVHRVEASGSVVEVTASQPNLAKLLASAESLGLDFALPDGSSDTHNATGMKKHTLDRRFNSAENIQTRTNRGAKRSKRSNRGDQQEA